MENNMLELKRLALASNATFKRVKITSDKKVFSVVIDKNAWSLYVLFVLIEDKYLAYDITSDMLPSELYTDTPRQAFTAQSRSKEIIKNVGDILNGNLIFVKQPSFFNKQKGYISLRIDGKETKVYQKKNVFDLPAAS